MAGFNRGFGGGFGGGNQMQQLMKQAQKMQEQMQKAQEELENTEVEGSSGGGAVTVVMDGKKVVSSITIKPEIVDPDDIEMLEDLIMAAYNDALSEAEDLYNEVMGPLGNNGGMF
ncbi:MAG: YbaB/EbfC family nucleoid-associated protein [Clostridia bacterium]|nr:YbaB/EbfC family nucleoid-associated protein [Clostridia bacterium]